MARKEQQRIADDTLGALPDSSARLPVPYRLFPVSCLLSCDRHHFFPDAALAS
jgi:hypothetical protein